MFGMFDNPRKPKPVPPPSPSTQSVTDEAARQRAAAAKMKGRDSTAVASRREGYGTVGAA